MTAPVVKGHGQTGLDKAELEKLPKAKLIAMILEQCEDTRISWARLLKLVLDIDIAPLVVTH